MNRRETQPRNSAAHSNSATEQPLASHGQGGASVLAIGFPELTSLARAKPSSKRCVEGVSSALRRYNTGSRVDRKGSTLFPNSTTTQHSEDPHSQEPIENDSSSQPPHVESRYQEVVSTRVSTTDLTLVRRAPPEDLPRRFVFRPTERNQYEEANPNNDYVKFTACMNTGGSLHNVKTSKWSHRMSHD